jgi:hypothetical protein
MSANATTPNPPPGRPWQLGLLVFVLFGSLAAGVAYYGIQDQQGRSRGTAKDQPAVAGFVTRIELPVEDTPIPEGPHRDEFRAACMACHSARLVFTQPRLTDGQWSKVVQKMTGKYGAPLTGDDEKRIVQYLHAVHGKS